jgi:hypothetical protein
MDGAPPFHPTVTEAIRYMAATGLPMRPTAHHKSFYTLDDPIYDQRYKDRKAAIRAGAEVAFGLHTDGIPQILHQEMEFAVADGLMRRDGEKYFLTPSGWAHAERQQYLVTADELDAAEAALEQVEARSEKGRQYAHHLTRLVEELRRDTRAWKKPKGALSRPAMLVLSKMDEAGEPIERRPGGSWCIQGSDGAWSTGVQTIRSLQAKGMLEQGDGPEWKAPRTLTDKGRDLARRAGDMTAKWTLTRDEATELADWLSQASALWLASAPALSGQDRSQFEVWADEAGNLAAKLGPARHYVVDERTLRRYNDPESRADSMAYEGGYNEHRIEIVPLADIDVPKVWSEGKFEQALARLVAHEPMDPIDASPGAKGRWAISDGIHRSNASLALGYTHIPVLTSTFVETPEAYVPEQPEKPRLQVGDWVKLREGFRGARWGWVSDPLGDKHKRGVKRHCYGIALVQKDSDWPSVADHCDDEFDVAKPPAWAVKAKREAEGIGWEDG